MKSEERKSIAAFIIPAQVQLLDFSGPAQVFYEAVEYGASIELKFVSMQESDVPSSCGISFTNLTNYQDIELEQDDIIFIPGMDFNLLTDHQFLFASRHFLRWIKEQHDKGVTLCSVCTGAFLLAEAGLLNNREATTHWKYFTVFKQRFPKTNLVDNRLFVDGANIYTSAGVSSGIDLALYILEKRYGSLFASSIAREIVMYFRRGASDPQLSVFLQYRNHLEERIQNVQQWITHHFHEKFTMEDIAEKVNMSSRNLSRLFKETTGITISQYLEKLRIEHAVQLLRENNKVEMIAHQCGFQSTNQLRHLFKKHVGVLPSEYSLS